MKIEVAYALPERQWLAVVEVADGATVMDAARSALAAGDLPALDPGDCVLGVWGRKVAPERVLSDGERVEIYRPLKADPKEVRRALAAAGKTMGGERR
ncbi:MAG TPA: RnfH family protein [Gammaproteobacteria bacterium]|jgi:putative ubiquitin-RnfH superfamily antitoxin RatB of RatAB toxin-antitoxin module|nr:RnfH family protein [Gammaproteobacteria bacterium]